MKEWKLTTMPSVVRKGFVANPEFLLVFNQLRDVLMRYEKNFEVRNQSETHYELWTRHAFRTKSFRPKQMKGVLFAGITIVKHHVGLYYYPLHIEEALKEELKPSVVRVLIGRSTLHIKKIPEGFLDDIDHMLQVGVSLYRNRNWI